MAEDNAKERSDVEEKEADDSGAHKPQVVTEAGEEILGNPADEITQSVVPANNHGILRDSDPGTKSRSLDEFSEFHIVDDFHGQPAMRAAGLIRGALHELKGSSSHIERKMRVANPVRVGGEVKDRDEEGDERFLPESHHFYVAEKRKVVEILLLCKSDGAANNIRFESHVRIGKKQPLARSGFVSFLEGMWLAEPAGRKIGDMNYPKSRMQSGEIIQDAARGIPGTVVHSHDFETWIINFHQRGERGRQFLFFVARRKQYRDARALGVGRKRNILNHGES